MKRTQIQLDDRTYASLRRQAYERGCSMSFLVRESLAEYLRPVRKRRRTLRQFSFVGAGGSRQGDLAPVSEHHDEALRRVWNTKRKR